MISSQPYLHTRLSLATLLFTWDCFTVFIIYISGHFMPLDEHPRGRTGAAGHIIIDSLMIYPLFQFYFIFFVWMINFKGRYASSATFPIQSAHSSIRIPHH
ncbi:hypothetical protein FRC19_007071 [Serendipita sp. 401]|nr:hypothetical protein FRC19_007071 [Serendipita sp. 401]KAG9054062.1 hypothetical protein FS842_006313 [Serendipita sp. 407]